MNLIHKDPADLRPHPKVKELLRWSKGSEDLNNLAESIREHGVLVPIIITEDGRIMDGVTRWTAAKQMSLDKVPCMIKPESRLEVIAIGSETQRRHLTKSQLAFKYYPLIADAFGERTAALAELRRAGTAASMIPSRRACGKVSKRVSDFAAKLGVSLRLLEYSDQLHTLFEETDDRPILWKSWDAKKRLSQAGLDPAKTHTPRAYVSAAVMLADDPAGLEAIVRGMAFLKFTHRMSDEEPTDHPGGKPEHSQKQLDLFRAHIEQEFTRWEYFKKLNDEQQDEIFLTAGKLAEKLSADECKARAAYHAKLARMFEKKAKVEA